MIVHSAYRSPDTCHSCDVPITEQNAAQVVSTCADCADDCLCAECAQLRADIAEDRREQLDLDSWRELRS